MRWYDKIGVINLILCLVRSLLESVNGLPRTLFIQEDPGIRITYYLAKQLQMRRVTASLKSVEM